MRSGHYSRDAWNYLNDHFLCDASSGSKRRLPVVSKRGREVEFIFSPSTMEDLEKMDPDLFEQAQSFLDGFVCGVIKTSKLMEENGDL